MSSNAIPPGPVVYTAADINHYPIQLFDRYNETYTTDLATIDYYRYNGIVAGMIYASQIGACLAVLIILLILTRAEKRKSPVFILNASALFFNIIAAFLQCFYYTGAWYSPYVFLSGDYFSVPESAKRISIAPGPFIVMVTIAIEASLVLQLKVVCVTFTSMQKVLVTLFSTLVALIAIGFRIAQVIINTEFNIEQAAWCANYLWLYQAQAITLTISIVFFSLAFCVKLGWSLHQRRSMGLTQFGPMQIVFIGGFQTLIIPALFTILQFAHTVPEISSNILTVTAISLPLSSLWASGSTSKPSAGARGPDAHRRFIVDSTTASSAGTRNKSIGETYGSAGGDGKFGSGSSRGTGGEKGRIGILGSVGESEGGSPREGRFPTEGLVERDLEMQELRGKY